MSRTCFKLLLLVMLPASISRAAPVVNKLVPDSERSFGLSSAEEQSSGLAEMSTTDITNWIVYKIGNNNQSIIYACY